MVVIEMSVSEFKKSKKYKDIIEAKKKKKVQKDDIAISITFPESLKPQCNSKALNPPKEYEFPVKEVSSNGRLNESNV